MCCSFTVMTSHFLSISFSEGMAFFARLCFFIYVKNKRWHPSRSKSKKNGFLWRRLNIKKLENTISKCPERSKNSMTLSTTFFSTLLIENDADIIEGQICILQYSILALEIIYYDLFFE